ncbi:hypothetical protein SLEP1_g31717 [Rubroshorea leprosula]|uniref:Uncharacterized protein n=1 Tax=Rubroshorea leprosula TaxID=152421 RepID=A0AAV5K463_9ROSI|nr:hypothetical protein SLEP1_g31717 [Rubroshorea leprosula]
MEYLGLLDGNNLLDLKLGSLNNEHWRHSESLGIVRFRG